MKSIAVSPLCRNYTCCSLNLQGHHSLVEHFEEFYIVIDPCSQLVSSQPYPYSYSAPSASSTLDLYIPHTTQVLEAVRHSEQQHRKSQSQLQPQQYQRPQQEHKQGTFDPDDMELDMDSFPASSSAFHHPLTLVTAHLVPYTTQRAFDNEALFTPSSLPQPLSCPLPVPVFDSTSGPQSRASTSTTSTFSQTQRGSFSTYSAHSDNEAVTSSLQASQDITSASSSRQKMPCSFVRKDGVVVDGNNSSGAQATKGEPHAVECETERRLHLFACGIDNCQRRYLSMKSLRKSLPCPNPIRV